MGDNVDADPNHASTANQPTRMEEDDPDARG